MIYAGEEGRLTEKHTEMAVNILLTQYKEIFEEGRMVIRSAHQFMFFIWVITGTILGYGLASSNPSILIFIPLILTYALSAILHAFIDNRTRIRKTLKETQDKIIAVLGEEYKQNDLFIPLKFDVEKKRDNILLYSGVGCVTFLYVATWVVGAITFSAEYPDVFYSISSDTIIYGLSFLYFIFICILAYGAWKVYQLNLDSQ